jgi:hypothetical protein
MLRRWCVLALFPALTVVSCTPLPKKTAGDAEGGADGDSGEAGAPSVSSLPDGSSCKAAPADAPGAEAAWQRYLDWHAANAAACGNTEVLPTYDCFVRLADPRRISAFTACMMADGCNSISNEDACLANPDDPSAGFQLSGAAEDWYQNVCLPKQIQCGFSEDNCGVFSDVLRPELRCAIIACIEGPCSEFDHCMKNVRASFSVCSSD